MAIVLLKNMTQQVNIIEQQQSILKYATAHGIAIHSTEIETSDSNFPLEERKEFKGFLRSLNDNESLLIHDLWALSLHVDELVKIFECLLKRNITLHVCSTDEVISNELPAVNTLSVLVRVRDEKIHPKPEAIQGRPKGRMSKSKFDIYRPKVIAMLEDGASVSEISKALHVSRSSLKDYINSRGLKELAKTKKKLLHATPAPTKPKHTPSQKECDLISQSHTNPQGAY
jgi:DNA invertase Pin-like site-specific DNA recombinase